MLECIECGARTKDFEFGWAAVRVHDPDAPSAEAEIVVYCGRCFAFEFAGLRVWLEPGQPPDSVRPD